MRLGHVEIPVSDPLGSAEFYGKVLGMQLGANQADRYMWLVSGEAVVLLRPGFGDAPDEDDLAEINLVFYSDDLAADAARLESHGVRFTERDNCLHFRDPDGHWLQLVDPGGDHSGGDGG